MSKTPRIGESITTAGGRTATRVEPSRYGKSILATNEREGKPVSVVSQEQSEVHKSLSDAALQEAHERLEQILCGGGL